MWTPRVVTPSAVEPVSLDEIKRQCSLDPSQTALDTAFILWRTAARKWLEARTGRTIHQAVLEWTLDCLPCEDYIPLPRATPLITIDSFVYVDSTGTSNMWAASNYIADTRSTPGRLVRAYGISWPSFVHYPVAPIRIQYTAGIATTSPITEADAEIKVPLLLMIAGLYENREPEAVTDRATLEAVALKYNLDAFLAQLTVYS